MLVQLFYFVQFENRHETIRHSSKQTSQNFLNTEFKHGEEINFMSNKHRLEINLIFINCPCPLKIPNPPLHQLKLEIQLLYLHVERSMMHINGKKQEIAFALKARIHKRTNLYQEYS